MPLSKSIPLASTVAVPYWVVTQAHFDMAAGTVALSVKGYVSKAAFDAGKPAIEGSGRDYTVPIVKSAKLFTDVLAYLEGAVLAQSDFAGGSTTA